MAILFGAEAFENVVGDGAEGAYWLSCEVYRRKRLSLLSKVWEAS